MAQFQIWNKEGKAISMKELDKEVCEFWGVEEHPKKFACPNEKPHGVSWYDQIGYAITDPDNYMTMYTNHQDPYKNIAWIEVAQRMTMEAVSTLLTHAVRDEHSGHYTMLIRHPNIVGMLAKGLAEYHKPYLELMKYWEDKGYIPIRLWEN